MNTALLLAAGKSERFGSDKLFAELGGGTVLEHVLQRLEASRYVDVILIAANRMNMARVKKIVRQLECKKVRDILVGGKTRYESVAKLVGVAPRSERFIIHNAANPWVTEEEVKAALQKCRGKVFGVAVGRPVVSTLKKMRRGIVEKTLPREDVWEVETPQVVNAQAFVEACRKFPSPRFHFTDDLAVLEAAGEKTAIVLASPNNRKITTPADFEMLHARPIASVGIGEDSHAFEKSKQRKKCMLGGVAVPELPPFDADSDGDVVLHALCNAVSSALGKSSIGTYATMMHRRGVRDSRVYFKKVMKDLRRQHRAIAHCSIAIEGSRPSIASLEASMKQSIAKLCRLAPEHVGITATSGKNLTPFGRGEAVRCHVSVLLK